MILANASSRVCASARQQRRVVCAAQAERPAAVAARRAVLFGAMLPVFINAPKAMALILDEEDEELVEKAKANRAQRLAEQRATTRTFMQEEGLANKQLDKKLIPVQKAVYKLAQSGSQLESGDIQAASRTLSEDWVGEFSTAATKVSTTSADSVLTKLTSLQSNASKGDLNASKRSYVELVEAIQAWASTSGVSGALKGL